MRRCPRSAADERQLPAAACAAATNGGRLDTGTIRAGFLGQAASERTDFPPRARHSMPATSTWRKTSRKAANSLGVPESQFLPDEDRPSLVAWDIARAKQKENRPQPAVTRLPDPSQRYATRTTEKSSSARVVVPQEDEPEQRRRRTEPSIAAPTTPTTPIPQTAIGRTSGTPSASPAAQLGRRTTNAGSRAGEPSRERPDKSAAPAPLAPRSCRCRRRPKLAHQTNSRQTRQRPAVAAAAVATDTSDATPKQQPAPTKPPKSLIDSADEAQQVVLRKLYAEVGKRQSEAIRLREKDPERALATLREAQQLVNDSKLPESSRRELLSRIDKTLHETQKYIKDHTAPRSSSTSTTKP